MGSVLAFIPGRTAEVGHRLSAIVGCARCHALDLLDAVDESVRTLDEPTFDVGLELEDRLGIVAVQVDLSVAISIAISVTVSISVPIPLTISVSVPVAVALLLAFEDAAVGAGDQPKCSQKSESVKRK